MLGFGFVFGSLLPYILTACIALSTRRVWDLETGECRQTLEGHSGQVSSVGITPDGRTAISGSWDKTVRAFEGQG